MQLEQGLHSEADRLNAELQLQGFYVDDYDTKIYRKKKVRLRGVIAPLEGQHFHKEAAAWLDDKLTGEKVNVFVYETDKHRRFVADVCLQSENRLVQVAMLRNGLTWHYALQDKRCELAELEEEAKKSRKGMWKKGTNLQPPWIYRKKQRDKRTGKKAESDAER